MDDDNKPAPPADKRLPYAPPELISLGDADAITRLGGGPNMDATLGEPS